MTDAHLPARFAPLFHASPLKYLRADLVGRARERVLLEYDPGRRAVRQHESVRRVEDLATGTACPMRAA